MKKIILIMFFIFLCFQNASFAIEEVNLEFDENYKKHSINLTRYEDRKHKETAKEEIIEENSQEKENLDDYAGISTPTMLHTALWKKLHRGADIHNLYQLQSDNTSVVTPLLKEKMTKHFDKGPVESIHTWAAFQNNIDMNFPEEGNSYTKYDMNLINVLFDGKMKDSNDNFRLMLNASHQHQRPFMQNFIQDAFYETKKIPHHSILFGNSRVGTGLEGTQSPYTLPLLNRSQISRNFSNIRKVGVRVRGESKYADYDFGGYSSGTFFSEFMPGAEFNSWINLKPLAKKGEKYGKLTTGSGVSLGKRDSTGYVVYGAGIQYTYKKIWTRAEYSLANGSNGATGLTSKHRQGWYVTLGYKLNKKAEIVARYDEFNPDKSANTHNRREYTTGINYYIKGQALKLVLNYIFCENELKNYSHRILIGAQMAL